MSNEYELKFTDIDKDQIREKLVTCGFKQVQVETLYKRQTFHLPKKHPEHEFKWGRVRDEGKMITATVKWYDNPENPSISDVHEEEIIVKNWDEGVSWIKAKGFLPTAYSREYA